MDADKINARLRELLKQDYERIRDMLETVETFYGEDVAASLMSCLASLVNVSETTRLLDHLGAPKQLRDMLNSTMMSLATTNQVLFKLLQDARGFKQTEKDELDKWQETVAKELNRTLLNVHNEVRRMMREDD